MYIESSLNLMLIPSKNVKNDTGIKDIYASPLDNIKS